MTALTDRVSPCWMSLNQHPSGVSFWRKNTLSGVTFRVHKWLPQKPRAIHHAVRRGHLQRVRTARDRRELPAPCFPAYRFPLLPVIHFSRGGNRRWSQWSRSEGGRGQAQEGTRGAHTRIHKTHRETERGQACFLLAACYKYYLSGQIFCFENSQIPRTASTHQSQRRGKKCQCFLHPKTNKVTAASRLTAMRYFHQLPFCSLPK